jgi:polyisoprenoid-binding protein YceI
MKKIFLLLLFLAPSAWAQRSLNAIQNESWVQYQLDHPMHVTVGKSPQVQGVIRYNDATQQIQAVAITVTMQTFNSNNSSRDSHMLEVVEAIKFPRVTFSSNSVVKSGDQLTVSGNLTFHGETRPVQFKAKTWVQGGKMFVQGNFDVSLAAFKVTPPSFMMVACNDALKMSFRGVFRM